MNDRSAFFVITVISASLFSRLAHAQSEAAPAQRYAEQSRAILGSAAVGTSASLTLGGSTTGLRADAELRWLFRGWVLAPRLGIAGHIAQVTFAGSPSTMGGATVVPGLAAGLLRPIAHNVLLGVLLSYRFEAGGSAGEQHRIVRTGHTGAIEAPLTVIISPNAFIEPALSVAVSHLAQQFEFGAGSGEQRSSEVTAHIAVRAGYVF